MALKIITTKQFNKDLKTLLKSGKKKYIDIVYNIIDLLQNGYTLDKKYKDHILTPNKNIEPNTHCVHLAFDLLLLYKIDSEALYLLQLGTHHTLKGFKESLEDIDEDIEKHEELNPLLWEDNELKKDVKDKILEIVEVFKEFVEDNWGTINVKDIIIVGSNANYNYTKDSDLDIHIVVDGIDDENVEEMQKVYNLLKSSFNSKYDIILKGIEAEVYVEVNDFNVNSKGIYSLYNGWLKEPTQEDIPDIDVENDTYIKEWEDKYNEVIENPTIEDINKIIDGIYALRQKGIKRKGEFSKENLTFKKFRNRGYLDKLKELKDTLISDELSLEEVLKNLK